MTDEPDEPSTQGLTATSEEELDTIERTLDTIGVDYDVRTVYVVEVDEVPQIMLENADFETTEPQATADGGASGQVGTPPAVDATDETAPVEHGDDETEPQLPQSGMRKRVATKLDCMDRRWADAATIADELNVDKEKASQALSQLYRKKNCVSRRKQLGNGRRGVQYEYRLKKQFKGELCPDDVGADVERALEDPSRNAMD